MKPRSLPECLSYERLRARLPHRFISHLPLRPPHLPSLSPLPPPPRPPPASPPRHASHPPPPGPEAAKTSLPRLTTPPPPPSTHTPPSPPRGALTAISEPFPLSLFPLSTRRYTGERDVIKSFSRTGTSHRTKDSVASKSAASGTERDTEKRQRTRRSLVCAREAIQTTKGTRDTRNTRGRVSSPGATRPSPLRRRIRSEDSGAGVRSDPAARARLKRW